MGSFLIIGPTRKPYFSCPVWPETALRRKQTSERDSCKPSSCLLLS